MKRQVTAVGIAAIVSASCFALVAGLWWMVTQLIVTRFAHLAPSWIATEYAVFTIVTVIVAFVTAAIVGEITPLREQMHRVHLPTLHLHLRH